MPADKVCKRLKKVNPEVCGVKFPVKTANMEAKDYSKLKVKQVRKLRIVRRIIECACLCQLVASLLARLLTALRRYALTFALSHLFPQLHINHLTAEIDTGRSRRQVQGVQGEARVHKEGQGHRPYGEEGQGHRPYGGALMSGVTAM